jgi:SAM-dependent methyltransferase
MPRVQVPRSYVGVDLNHAPRSAPSRQWATLHWDFDFTKNHKKLGQFDLVTCLEVLEHVRQENQLIFIKALRACLRQDGKLLLSTPVFNGKAAANHLHELTVPELTFAIGRAGLRVERRFGTFASQRDLKKVAQPAELDIVKRLGEYYSGEVLSTFLAPLYPDASRNCVWLLRHKDQA